MEQQNPKPQREVVDIIETKALVSGINKLNQHQLGERLSGALRHARSEAKRQHVDLDFSLVQLVLRIPLAGE